MNLTKRLLLLLALAAIVPACGHSDSGGGAPPAGPGASPAAGVTKTVSLASLVPGNSNSNAPDVSSDGRYVCFQSLASNLVPNDTNGLSDIFVKDLQTKLIERVSVSTNGVQTNSNSFNPRISNDGRYVVFSSYASNLVPGDTNGAQDIFVRDRIAGTTIRVSVGIYGQSYTDSYFPEISGNGRTIVFLSRDDYLTYNDFSGYPDVFAYDMGTGSTELISVGYYGYGDYYGGCNNRPAVSEDGSRIVFASQGLELTSPPKYAFAYSYNSIHVFMRDRNTGTTTVVNSLNGINYMYGSAMEPAISDDGTKVTFYSGDPSGELVPGALNGNIYLKDLNLNTLSVASSDSTGNPMNGFVVNLSQVTDNGQVLFAAYDTTVDLPGGVADGNSAYDILVKDINSGFLSIISLPSSSLTLSTYGVNAPFWPEFFYTYFFGFDIISNFAALTPSGRHVVFVAQGLDLVPGDTGSLLDIILRDRNADVDPIFDEITDVTTGITYLPGLTNGHNFKPSVSDDGTQVAFESLATSLVAGDGNAAKDVFVRDTGSDATIRISVSSGGAEGLGDSSSPSISATGRYVAFSSKATNLDGGDGNGLQDIFLRNRDVLNDGFDGGDVLTFRVSVDSGGADPNGPSAAPAISGDGTQVAFESLATDLVAPATTALRRHIYVRNLTAGTTTLISVSGSLAEGNGDSFSPAISNDGRYVVFASFSTNLVGGDTNGVADVFLVDRDPSTNGLDGADRSITRISVTAGGGLANGGSYTPSISGDGARIVFASDASNLVSGDGNGAQDIFLHIVAGASTSRVSLGASGNEADSACAAPAISRDGRMVAFQSIASNLVADETLGLQDIFVRDLSLGTTVRASLSFTNGETDGESYSAALNGDGAYVAFYSNATNIQDGDSNGYADVFLRGPLFP